MKTILSKTDKVSIIKGLREGVFLVHELNHLVKVLYDYSAEIELFGEISLPLTSNDKRHLLAGLRSGSLDFSNLPDLTERISENFFLSVMKECD